MFPKIKTRLGNAKRTLGKTFSDALLPRTLFYIITHERSGTHFLINALWKNTKIREGYHNIGEWFGPYDDSKAETRFKHIDRFVAGWKTAFKKGNIIKSHCDRELFEARYPPAKIVYVLRDPRDTLTSFFHYLNNRDVVEYLRENNPMLSDQGGKSISEFIRRPSDPFLRYCYSIKGSSNVAERWADHVAGWRNAPDTLTVRYEDLHGAYEQTLNSVSHFLGLKLVGTPQKVDLHEGLSVLPRKGVIGDWRNSLSKEDESFLRRAIESRDLKWEEIIAKP